MSMSAKTMAVLAATFVVAACGGEQPSAPLPSPDEATHSTTTPASATTTAAAAPLAWNQCKSCHALEPGRNGIGPSLHGVIGRKAGSLAGYAYSPALRNSGIVWDRTTLDTWLQAPMKMVPGSKMIIGLPDAAGRKAVIDFLEAQP